MNDCKVTPFSSPYTRCLQTTAGIVKGLKAGQNLAVGPITIQEELSEVSQYMNAPPGSELHQDIEKLAINALGTKAFVDKHIRSFQDTLADDVQIVNPRKES